MPYELEWQERYGTRVTPKGEASELGLVAAKRARKHRRKAVQEALGLKVAKDEIVKYLLKRVNPQRADAYFDHVPNFNAPLDQLDWEKIWIEKSQVGARLHTKTEVTLNAESVIAAAFRIVDNRGSKPKGNWHKIECRLRVYFETAGEKSSLAPLEKLALTSDEEDNPNYEARRETLRKLIHSLWNEYGFAD